MGWTVLFIAAALFNFAAGVPLLVAPHENLALMHLPPVADVMYHQVTGLLIICFGVGYGLVAGDQTRNHGIVWLGAAGKIGVIVLMAQAYAAGTIPFQAFSIALGDMAFVVGFIAFLLTRPRAA
jgi:hypothetical protein